MNVEIDLNQLVDNSISVVIVLLWFFVGMRVLYGYWPWQQGPKRQRLRPGKPKPDTSATPNTTQPVAARALQPDPAIGESQPNGTPVPALALSPNSGATGDSFDRSLINLDEARSQVA